MMQITETQNDTIRIGEAGFDLGMLEEMDDMDYLLEIIETLLDESPRELKEIKEALLAGNTNMVSKKAHKLKSTAGVIQAERLTGLLVEIETLSKTAGITDELIDFVEAATVEYSRIERALRDYVDKLKL
jgi:HPt (histidine-containing phosphotransfer) domain-containing protein